jgi:hypothetical protein
MWRGVFFLVRLYLTLDPKVYATKCIFARDWGPQSGVRLAKGTEAVFHSPSSNGFLAGSQPSISVYFNKYLEHGGRICPSFEVQVHIVGHTECIPSLPMLVH